MLSFFVGDLAVSVKSFSAGADGDQRHGHHQRKYQRKNFFIRFLLPFKYLRSAGYACRRV